MNVYAKQKRFPFPSRALQGLARGSPWLQTLHCNSLLILNKPIFPGEISDSLFASCQQRTFSCLRLQEKRYSCERKKCGSHPKTRNAKA